MVVVETEEETRAQTLEIVTAEVEDAQKEGQTQGTGREDQAAADLIKREEGTTVLPDKEKASLQVKEVALPET